MNLNEQKQRLEQILTPLQFSQWAEAGLNVIQKDRSMGEKYFSYSNVLKDIVSDEETKPYLDKILPIFIKMSEKSARATQNLLSKSYNLIKRMGEFKDIIFDFTNKILEKSVWGTKDFFIKSVNTIEKYQENKELLPYLYSVCDITEKLFKEDVSLAKDFFVKSYEQVDVLNQQKVDLNICFRYMKKIVDQSLKGAFWFFFELAKTSLVYEDKEKFSQDLENVVELGTSLSDSAAEWFFYNAFSILRNYELNSRPEPEKDLKILAVKIFDFKNTNREKYLVNISDKIQNFGNKEGLKDYLTSLKYPAFLG